MITRTKDATLINRIAANPEVRSTYNIHINSFAPLDFTELCQRDDYYVLTNGEDACAIFDQISPVIFDSHSIFDETCRGKRAVETGKAFVEWMFENTQALIVYGKTPVENKRARMFNRLIGATSDGVGMFDASGAPRPYEVEFFHISKPHK